MLYVQNVQIVLIVLIDTAAEDEGGSFGISKTGLNPPVMITNRLKAVFSVRFHFIMFGAVHFLNVLILILLCFFIYFNQ